MRSLKVLCNSRDFPKIQKDRFKQEVAALLSEGGKGKEGALHCLRLLWRTYDLGGHSVGRSLRSLVLEQVIAWSNGKGVAKTNLRKAKTALSILVAMHYDHEYINKHRWFDFHLESISAIPLSDRVLVSAAAMALGVDDIPLLEDWSTERIIAFVREYD